MEQSEKGLRFRELHERVGAFVIPNPWDVGSARVLAHMGFEALASTSAGFAFSLGIADGAVDRETMMRHLAALADATELPVNGDLGNGFGDRPEECAATIRDAAAAGLVGGSIEDATGVEGDPVYEIELAVERVRAAAEAARGLPFDFVLTARAENYLYGRRDLADTIKRLQAFQGAGADVLYAPGIRTREEIRAVVESVDRPVNVLVGMPGMGLSRVELEELGVKRISLGGALARAALGTLVGAAREMGAGRFGFVEGLMGSKEIEGLFESK